MKRSTLVTVLVSLTVIWILGRPQGDTELLEDYRLHYIGLATSYARSHGLRNPVMVFCTSAGHCNVYQPEKPTMHLQCNPEACHRTRVP